MPDVTQPQPFVPEGAELSFVPRTDGNFVEVKRTSDGVSALIRTDGKVQELCLVARLLASDNLVTLFIKNIPLYKNGERLLSVTSGNWTARR